MKTSFILFMLSWSLLAAQSNMSSNFTTASIEKGTNEHTINFTLAKEANVKYYIIEGSNDSIAYEFVSVVKSKGNSVLPLEYHTTININLYSVYRVKQIDMNGTTTEVCSIGRLQNPTDHITSK